MVRIACPACKYAGAIEPDTGDSAWLCPACGGPLLYSDPVNAAAQIMVRAAALVPVKSRWRIVRRELLIGLGWGVALALVMTDLARMPLYRTADGQLHLSTPYHGIPITIPPGAQLPTFWDKALVYAQETTPLILLPCAAGLAVGLCKASGRRRVLAITPCAAP